MKWDVSCCRLRDSQNLWAVHGAPALINNPSCPIHTLTWSAQKTLKHPACLRKVFDSTGKQVKMSFHIKESFCLWDLWWQCTFKWLEDRAVSLIGCKNIIYPVIWPHMRTIYLTKLMFASLGILLTLLSWSTNMYEDVTVAWSHKCATVLQLQYVCCFIYTLLGCDVQGFAIFFINALYSIQIHPVPVMNLITSSCKIMFKPRLKHVWSCFWRQFFEIQRRESPEEVKLNEFCFTSVA